MSKQNGATRLNVFSVREFEGSSGKANSWTRIGAAFPHRESGGFNIELQALPLNGRLVVLPLSEEERGAAGE